MVSGLVGTSTSLGAEKLLRECLQGNFTLYKHPKEGCEMKISQDNLTDAPDLDHGLIVVGLDQVLKEDHI